MYIFKVEDLCDLDFIPVKTIDSDTIIPSDYLGGNFLFSTKPYAKLLKDQHQEEFLKMHNPIYPILMKFFYENLKTHTYYDALRTTVEGKVIALTPKFFVTHLKMKNEGVMMRMDGDE